MSQNEIFAPNGPHNKMSLPVKNGSTNAQKVVPGVPVVVGAICGVAQTAREASDGATTGVVNSNAPGYATVWNGGTWRLPVDTTGQAVVEGSPIYADLTDIATTSVVTLFSDGATGLVPFGYAYEAASGATVSEIAVRVREYIGEALA